MGVLQYAAAGFNDYASQNAYTQLQTIIANVVRDFKFANTDGGDKVVGTDYSSLFSRPLSPAVVSWERRDSSDCQIILR